MDILTLIWCKNVNICYKKTESNPQKEARESQLKKIEKLSGDAWCKNLFGRERKANPFYLVFSLASVA